MTIETLRARLEEAIPNGEWFEIIYHGGSRPGSKRKIAPIAVFQDRVRARCYTSDAVKPFMLAKIEIVEIGVSTSAPVWSDPPPLLPQPSIVDTRCVHRIYAEELITKGWNVELEELEDGWSLHLTGFFKNGKPKRSPTHSLHFNHSTRESWFDERGALVLGDLKPRVRKWGFQSKTYTQFEAPVANFLHAAGILQKS